MLRGACIQDPEAIKWINHDTLHGEQRRGGVGGIGVLHFGRRIRMKIPLVEFGHREVSRIIPARKVDKDVSGVGNTHARRHGPLECHDQLEVFYRFLLREDVPYYVPLLSTPPGQREESDFAAARWRSVE